MKKQYRNDAVIRYIKGYDEKIIDYLKLYIVDGILNITWSKNGDVIDKSLLIPMVRVSSILCERKEVPNGN